MVPAYNHILMVFHYENPEGKPWRFSYAYKQETLSSATSAKRYTYVFGRDFRGWTAAERFSKLAESKRMNDDFVDAFSVEALNDEFFDLYRAYYSVFVEYITGERYSEEVRLLNIIHKFHWVKQDSNNQFTEVFDCDAKDVRDYIKKMFGRIIFLYFLQRKRWLYNNDGTPNPRYMHDLFAYSDKKETFLDDVLELLFFHVLNTTDHDKDGNKNLEYRTNSAKEDGLDITTLPGWEHIPYLNGGLFSKDENDEKKCVFPAEYFKELFDFLDSYNFTIDENDSEDAEIGIDPEMLGRIFENLLEDNKDKGAYYTPKPIVDYMCREAIINYLQNGYQKEAHSLIRDFVETLDSSRLNDEQKQKLHKKLEVVKVCDPAIGSGAFPMGIANILFKLYVALRSNFGKPLDRAEMKKYIFRNNIYGVDIEKGAVDIARLRFWLSLVVDEDTATPLPNLHFKIMQGNSLLEEYKGKKLDGLTMTSPDKEGSLPLVFEEGVQLQSDLARYYESSDHEEQKHLMYHIKNNIVRQIYDLTQNEHILDEIKDVTENDKFFLWHTWYSDVFAKGGFDIVIGNPPYLLEGKAPKYIFDAVSHLPSYLGKMDIWYMFASIGIDMLKPGGNLCFIAKNNWITNAGAKKFRNKVIEETQIVQMCDFKDYMIFETASIQTMIMQFKKSAQNESYTFDLRNLLGSTFEDVLDLLNKKVTENVEYLRPHVEKTELIDRYLTFSIEDNLLSKIRHQNGVTYLLDNEVSQGIVPNPDVVNSRNIKNISIVDRERFNIAVGDGVFVVPTDFFSSLEPTEQKYVKRLYEPTACVRYHLHDISDSNLLYITKQNFADDAPTLLNHLHKYHAIMDNRRENQNGRLEYYHLHWPRVESIFAEGAKIIVPRKTAVPTFSYTELEAYVMMAINIIRTDRVNLKYLTGILNSKLIKFWLKNRGKMQGANYQIDKEPLQQIPIIIPSDSIQQEVSGIVDNILSSISSEASIEQYESTIENIISHLYDLTYDEVLIIDPETPITREEYENFTLE